MDAVEEIKQRLAIEDVISEYVQLKRAGRNLKGLSPFNNEKTPSFMVSPDKQIWHDFSSGKGGNMFSFVMEMEGVDFKGALELLARKAGIDLEQFRGRPGNAKEKEHLYEALEQATKFYQVQLKNNERALQYVLKTREFSKQTVLDFRLGYSPNTGFALSRYLKKLGTTDEEMRKTGLIARNSRGSDMFRGRLMIPLQDSQGRVIGFTARLLDNDSDVPKYINTPQTPLYDKSRHVYGFHLAKEHLRKQGYAVLVEGNLDVIASHQAGIQNVVATAGTALTESHLKALVRFNPDIRLSFDADKAGLAATERAIPIASKVGASLSIITLSDGKDPDELIKKDPKLWQQAIEKPRYALDWLIDRYLSQIDTSSGAGKRAFTDALLPTLRTLSDPVEQDHYIAKVAGIIDVLPTALRSKVMQKADNKITKRSKASIEQREAAEQQQLEWAKAQDHLLAISLMRPSLRDQLELIDPEMMPQETAQRLLEYLQAHPDFDGNLQNAPLLHQIADYVKILSLQYEALFVDLDDVEARYEANRLRIRLIDMFVRTKKHQIAKALDEADDETARKLLTRVKTLDKLLKTSQEIV